MGNFLGLIARSYTHNFLPYINSILMVETSHTVLFATYNEINRE